MNNMAMMNNATAMQLSMLSRGGVPDDRTIIDIQTIQICCHVIIICQVIKMIVVIIQIVMKIKGKDRTEDKECKAGEEVK